MSAWKWMSPAARKEAVARYIVEGLDAPAIAKILGASVDQVLRSAGKYADALVHGRREPRDTDEGQPRPPEIPACEGTPTPAAAEHAQGEGGPDGGLSTVAGATSGGGEGGPPSRVCDAAALAPATARSSSPSRKVAGVIRPEPKSAPATDEVALTIFLPRFALVKLQELADRPRWTREQMAAQIVLQACNKV